MVDMVPQQHCHLRKCACSAVLSSAICCMFNQGVVTLVADKLKGLWLCIVLYFANCMHKTTREGASDTYNGHLKSPS